MKENWTSITVYNQTSYDILNTIPNAQYDIQILLASKDQDSNQENMVNALTAASSIAY